MVAPDLHSPAGPRPARPRSLRDRNLRRRVVCSPPYDEGGLPCSATYCRSAWFTAAESRNKRATSGSRRTTFVPLMDSWWRSRRSVDFWTDSSRCAVGDFDEGSTGPLARGIAGVVSVGSDDQVPDREVAASCATESLVVGSARAAWNRDASTRRDVCVTPGRSRNAPS